MEERICNGCGRKESDHNVRHPFVPKVDVDDMEHKEQMTIKNLILANGKVLVERTEHRQIYKVLKVAKNVNYESLGKPIAIGDLVVCDEYMYSNALKLNNKEYFIIRPKMIAGYFGYDNLSL